MVALLLPGPIEQEIQAVRQSDRLETCQQFSKIILISLFGGENESESTWNVSSHLSLQRKTVSAKVWYIVVELGS